jgi:hypothetical protein
MPPATVEPLTEPCPACGGTGRRVVAPEPKRRGGQPGRNTGPQHGYVATYMGGCRCELCRAARRGYDRHRKAHKGAS